MSKINYRSEVLKVYPDAVIATTLLLPAYFVVYSEKASQQDIWELGNGYTNILAWESAYETLKKQGKI